MQVITYPLHQIQAFTEPNRSNNFYYYVDLVKLRKRYDTEEKNDVSKSLDSYKK